MSCHLPETLEWTLNHYPLAYDEFIIFKQRLTHWDRVTHISGADNRNNRSNYDTSNRFGTNTLWGSRFKKKMRATQNFNMAAIFQDGGHGILLNVFFASKMALNGQKRLFWQQSVCVLSMQIAQLMLQIQFKCSYYFNMAANFQDGHYRPSCNISFALDGSGRSKRWFGEWVIYLSM